jgi:hypothetical protein
VRPRLEQILPAVERDLRGVQEDVEAIRRRLESGATPPASDLNRLRSRLEQLAPVLSALDVRADGMAAPSEETRQLLHGVRIRLAQTQVATAGLITALRRSELHGPTLDALLRELERFGELGSPLDFRPAAAFAPAAHSIDPAAPAADAPMHMSGDAPRLSGEGSSKPANALPRAEGAREAAGRPAPPPSGFAPGSSNASAAGAALSVAGFAALAALLIGLFLPRLLTRLELPPGRGHMVASVLALERPG